MSRSTRPTLVYQYGARVVDGADAYRDEERAMHRTYNALVELRRREIDGAREALRAHVPWVADAESRLAEIDAEIEELRARIRRANSSARTRDPDPGLQAEVRALRAARREIVGRHAGGSRPADGCECFGCRRKRAYGLPAVAAALSEVSAAMHAERKALYASREISWCGWNDVVRRVPSRGEPRFRAWRNTGGLVVAQIQGGGASWADLLAGEAQNAQHVAVEAEPLPEMTPGGPISPTGRRARRPRYRVRLRVGPDSRQRMEPRWVTARMTLHRPVPEDAIVQQVQLVRRRIGTHDKWHVLLVLSREAGWQRPAGAGVAALNLGYRHVGDGDRRVGYVLDDEGERRELVLPARFETRLRKCEELQAIRDRNFDVEREALVHWLATADVPEWLSEATSHLRQWRAQARLAGLVLRWREQRFAGDGEVYARLEAWRAQDKHLYDWQAHQRARTLRQRRAVYREWAAELRGRYERVLVDDTDYREILRTPEAEEHDTPERLNTRWHLRMCAPGMLRDAVVQAGVGVAVPAGYITTACSVCGAGPAPDWDRITEIEYRCEAGHRMDQDRNACANMLAASGAVVRE